MIPGATGQLRFSVSRTSCFNASCLLLFRLEPVVDPQLPTQQRGFRSGRSTVQQVVQLTSDDDESYEGRHKSGLLFVDLTADYDCLGSGRDTEATADHP